MAENTVVIIQLIKMNTDLYERRQRFVLNNDPFGGSGCAGRLNHIRVSFRTHDG